VHPAQLINVVALLVWLLPKPGASGVERWCRRARGESRHIQIQYCHSNQGKLKSLCRWWLGSSQLPGLSWRWCYWDTFLLLILRAILFSIRMNLNRVRPRTTMSGFLTTLTSSFSVIRNFRRGNCSCHSTIAVFTNGSHGGRCKAGKRLLTMLVHDNIPRVVVCVAPRIWLFTIEVLTMYYARSSSACVTLNSWPGSASCLADTQLHPAMYPRITGN